MTKKDNTTKVKALGPYKVINKKLGINYNFKSGEIYEVNKDHLEVLLNAKVCEEIKK